MRGTYGEPPTFCFDALCKDPPIVDNPELENYNLESRVEAFAKHVIEQVLNLLRLVFF